MDITVIKLGGHAMTDPQLFEGFVEDLAALSGKGQQYVVVHGGGPHINQLLDRLALESAFVNGLRITTPPILEAAEMALCGKVNKEITRALQKKGLRAAGISGEDGPILTARIKSPELGLVGAITTVDPGLIFALLDAGYMPVIAPLAVDEQGQALNINADTAAGAIAATLRASRFVLISDVPGVMGEDKKVFPRLDATQIQQLIDRGIISGGMIPKVECCQKAVNAGSQKALILDGRQKNSLKRLVEDGAPLGTEIIA